MRPATQAEVDALLHGPDVCDEHWRGSRASRIPAVATVRGQAGERDLRLCAPCAREVERRRFLKVEWDTEHA